MRFNRKVVRNALLVFCFCSLGVLIWRTGRDEGSTGRDEGNTGRDEGNTGRDEGNTGRGRDEGNTGRDEGRTGRDEGNTGRGGDEGNTGRGRNEDNTGGGRDEGNTGDEDEGRTDHDEGRTGDCKIGFAARKVATLYPGFGSVPIPMFLDSNFKRFPNITECGLPFGVNSQEEKIVEDILSATGNYSLGEDLDSLEEKRCIVVGNGGILTNKSLGQVIDAFDVVVRLNAAPVKGYEADVGSKTTMRILYPESCPKKAEQIEDQSLFVLAAFLAKDLKWFRHMIFKTPIPKSETFWAPVAQHVPREPADMRILNPYFIKEVSLQLIGLPNNKCVPTWGKNANIPTTGVVAITMALHHCDRVYVAGFGYNISDPDARLHYYENLKMSVVTKRGGHNIVKEKQFLAKLVKAGAIEDMTLGII